MEEQKIDLDKVRRDEGRRGTSSHHRPHRKRKKKKILKGTLIFLLILLLAGVGTVAYMFHSGQEKITRKGQASRPQLQPVHTEEVQIDTEILDEDTLSENFPLTQQLKIILQYIWQGIIVIVPVILFIICFWVKM